MDQTSLVEWVIANVDAQFYYKEKFPDWDGDYNNNITCPFSEKHKKGTDKRPSFSVNIRGEGGCFCHGCGAKIGSIVHAQKIFFKIEDDEQAASLIYSKYVRPVMHSNGELKTFSIALKSAPKIAKALKEEVQISATTVEKFQLGFDSHKRRVTIPIIDQWGQLLNVRLYQLPSMRDGDKYPKILNTDEYGKPAAMFPQRELLSLCRSKKHKPERVFWFTGERDTLLAWDRGIPSFCYTTGENVCKKEWIEEISALGVPVVIVEDNDDAGVTGAERRRKLLTDAKIETSVLTFANIEEVKDFSDFIQYGHSVNTFLEMATEGKEPSLPDSESDDEEIEDDYLEFPKILDPTKLPDFGEYPVAYIGRAPELLNKPIWTKAIVSGKMDRTYSVPCIFEVGEDTYRLPISRELIHLVRNNDVEILKQVGRMLGTKQPIRIIGHETVTEIEIIPMIEPGIDSIFVNQRCYYFGDSIECNKPYRMRVVPTTDMNTQENIGMVVAIEPVSNILDSYKFDENSCKILRDNFTPDSSVSLLDNLRSLAHEISTRFTGIMNRDDLHLVGLLTWLCPLQFEFPFEGIQRGWLNTLVLGDTETGKSKVCTQLTKLFQCGVFINAESCSYVGLVGGAVKSSSGMFILRWGKIPLYNRQLVVVEELSGLTTQEISYMSEIRSAGVARYDKAGLTGETSAKTRLICLSNVRGEGKSLADYPTGVQAALGLIGQNEDLARFDLTLTATDDEVSGAIINKDRTTYEQSEFSTEEKDAFKELAMFAWSLKPEQINFTIGAYRASLLATLKMCGKYHPSLPIFKAGSGRLKLARIAIAIACIQFAWDETADKLIVEAKHVETAAELLDLLYAKPSFGYARYSKTQFDLQKVLNEADVISKIEETFKEKELAFYTYISNSNAFTRDDLSVAMGVHFMFIERVLSQMFLSNLLKKGDMQREWKLSTAGRKWIEKQIHQKTSI